MARPPTRNGQPPPAPFIVEPIGGAHTYTLVLLHGLSSNGEAFGRELCEAGFSSSGRTLPQLLPTARFVFPTAPRRRSSAFGRSMLTQWFDIARLPDPAYRRELQLPGLQDTAQTLIKLLRQEQERVAPSNMILGGISQGCAASVSVLLSQHPVVQGLGGFVGMCGYLPFQGDLDAALTAAEEANQPVPDEEDFFGHNDGDSNIAETDPMACAAAFEQDLLDLPQDRITEVSSNEAGTVATARAVPVFFGHGREDDKKPVALAEAMAATMRKANYAVDLKIYEELGHWYKVPDEIDDIIAFIRMAVGWTV
ncbi:acyl-protein thioesterase [Ophiostoma piceae UAMH 11346]|uniref:Acyl-protein thioesterase n=1 Tax=Ophiostoma piceae (strain UAMH 11346) TaxID=1262450 RepID=S3C164_OPHP1|nr:acyl-protein thioesterase [Ophiostoma piceae UAMH 11346]